VVFTGYALPATAVKLPVWTACHPRTPQPALTLAPDGSTCADLEASRVIETFLLPDEKLTAEFELEEDITVVRVRVLEEE
jgi:hypothetical protein